MTDKEAYQHLQASWVRDNDVEVGDIVKVLRAPKDNELGSRVFCTEAKKEMVGNNCQVRSIRPNGVCLNGWAFPFFCDYLRVENVGCWPFFCLEVVKKEVPKIKLTCEVNGNTVPLSTLSEETLLKIRRQS